MRARQIVWSVTVGAGWTDMVPQGIFSLCKERLKSEPHKGIKVSFICLSFVSA